MICVYIKTVKQIANRLSYRCFPLFILMCVIARTGIFLQCIFSCIFVKIILEYALYKQINK